jgi:hypothetical protein
VPEPDPDPVIDLVNGVTCNVYGDLVLDIAGLPECP